MDKSADKNTDKNTGKNLDQNMNKNVDENTDRDVDALIALLDGCTQAGESRIKIDVVEGQGEVVSRQYHHGRCDVGSPWACGTPFDVLE